MNCSVCVGWPPTYNSDVVGRRCGVHLIYVSLRFVLDVSKEKP